MICGYTSKIYQIQNKLNREDLSVLLQPRGIDMICQVCAVGGSLALGAAEYDTAAEAFGIFPLRL